MGQNYLVAVIVYDTDGTTAMPNIRVTLRNESTNETLSDNTNSSGEVIFNLGNLTEDWSIGDKVTVFALYSGYEVSQSHTTTSGGGVTLYLTLVSKPSSPSLRYFVAQDFLDYFSLETTDIDSENGVNMQRLVKIGEMVEGGIDNDCGTRFDSANQVTTEYHDIYKKQATIYLDKAPLQSLQGFWINKADEDAVPVWNNLAYTLLDDCSSTSGWTASSDNSEVSLTVNYVPDNANHGLSCLYVAKEGANDTTLTITRGPTSVDFENKTLKIDVYIDTLTDLASTDSIKIRYGSASNAYFEKAFDLVDLNTGWNTLTMLHTDSDLTATGSPEIGSFDYFAIILELSGAAIELTSGDIRLDYLRIGEEDDLDIKEATSQITITDSDNYPKYGINQVKADYTYGYTTVPLDIKELAILETALRMYGAVFLRNKIGNRGQASMDFTQWFDSYRSKIIGKYNCTGISSN